MNNLEKDISSVEIARILGKRHDNIMRDIVKMFKQLGIGASAFESTYNDDRGKEYPCFILNQRYTRVLSSGYSAVERDQLVEFFMEHKAKVVTEPLLPQYQMIVDMATHLSNVQVDLDNTKRDVIQLQDEMVDVKKATGNNENFCSIKAWLNINGVRMPSTSTGPLGKKCTKRCKELGIEVTEIFDRTWGHVNVYPIDIIAEEVEKYQTKLKEK